MAIDRPPSSSPSTASVDLFWIPLGAGNRLVRGNGIIYEWLCAKRAHRSPLAVFHAAIVVGLGGAQYTIEVAPVPDRFGARRGVVATGPVGTRALARLRWFRYEVRCWADGVIPDLGASVASPVRVSTCPETARRVLDVLPWVPTFVWGRDELATGDPWTCNSVVSWTLASAGVDPTVIPLPPNARAPGWHAGCEVASRSA